MPARAWWGSRDQAALADLARLVENMPPEQLERFAANLDSEDLAVLEQAMGARMALGWRSDPATMANHLTQGRTHNRWRYVRLLSQKFKDAVEGRSTRQLWSLPSRYGKSTISSRWGPVWMLDQRPSSQLLLASYADHLADEHAVFVRDTMEQHAEVLSTRLRLDRRRADRFVTEHGGGLMAGGIRSGFTGFGTGEGGGVVVDDPFKNWIEAHSPTVRSMVWNQFRGVLRLRLDNDTDFIIVVHTRWHPEDLTGMILANAEDEYQESWEVVRIPAIAEAPSTNPLDPDWLRLPDPLDRKPGEPIEPERFTLEEVRTRLHVLGTYLAAGLEQQRPAPEEGGELKRAWWKLEEQLPPAFDDSISSWDVKGKDKETSDFVVGQVWGRTGGHAWLVSQMRGQYSQMLTKLAIVLTQVRHPNVRAHYVENTGFGPEVRTELAKGHPGFVVTDEHAGTLGMTDAERKAVERIMRAGLGNVLPVTPKGPKTVRARAQSGHLEGGHVHVLERDLSAMALIEEAAAFPNGSNDDMVDAWSQAMSKLLHGGATIEAPTGQRPEPRTGQGIVTPQPRILRLPRPGR